MHARRRPGHLVHVLAVLLIALVAAACATPSTDHPAGPTTQPPGPEITVAPADGASAVNPLDPVSVSTAGGTLETVTMTNEEGRAVEGIFTPDRLSWKPGVPLGYGRAYTVAVTAVGDQGVRSEKTSMFTTVTPGNQTEPTFVTTGGNLLADGATFGVGIVIVTHFDEPITDKVAAETALSVETTPPTAGSWYWADDQNVHWRPQTYWAPGTKVTVRASVYGKALGEGLFGQNDAATTFTIGDAHISVADDATKEVTVTDNGQVVRTMPTSMGMGGTEVVGGQTLSFWTQPGVYTVLDKANPVVMDSSTYGLPVNSRLGYKEKINYATRISNDGIYLHELADTIWAQGNTNVSHGCLNLSPDNARWFYDFSRPGDVVEVRGTGGAPLELWQNGDWSVPWDQWLAGSALR
ncbi:MULTISPECIES: Ig-like domain-containing protein [unclassified Rhodococcus (in: high G+C Gram-positive bacteria)]|uniref:L,D-transpeptidase n=1 Tax=unclassified Rhodococcus (in: high G+C Gram-positive bacteria) TaxID=192944 RepID=UPI00163B0CD1|nr:MULTISPECIES: Ig-like domain-containing protein [unclassified Rhodococcus (in: high G+C Gram-positive bacteria)]MBC2640724.1 L,D-transpeptidase family protein [Rhodococcus sp. 3A]MBC2894531.1 L,D-transpeptidase family protein [Rhodococcus sp. 4CII]